MNILIAVPRMDAGGVEVGVLEFCKKANKDINIFIATSGGKLLEQFDENIKIIKIDIKSKNPFIILKNKPILKKILIDNKIDLVQIESRIPAWNLCSICKKLNIPTISIIHGRFSIGKGLFGIIKKLYNSEIFKSDKIIAVSEFIKKYCEDNYKKYIKKDVDVVYRGIDVNYFNKNNVDINSIEQMKKEFDIPNNKTIIVCPARLSEIKGQLYLTKTLNYVKSAFVCYFVGENDKHSAYKEEIIDFAKNNNLDIRFINNITNMPALYSIGDIFVSPSIKPESFGRISIESQAMEKIFIGTAIGGTLETVIDNKTGFLAPYNDEIEFAKIIDKAINLSETEKKNIAENARKNVINNYDFEKFYNKTINIIKATSSKDS